MIDINTFDPMTLVLIAVLNPATIAVAFLLGRKANQPQKILIAALAAALCGFLLYWVAAFIGLIKVHALGGEAGMILVQTVAGLIWAALGYYFFHEQPRHP
jgi:small neutral amino acid transporter SnatA (MarC family)